MPTFAPQDAIPRIDDSLEPPVALGMADLASFAYRGHDFRALAERVVAFHVARGQSEAGRLFDAAVAVQLDGRREEALALQEAALGQSALYRVARLGPEGGEPPLRVLALASPGDFMMNIPLDFIAAHLDVRLDLLFLAPGRPLPSVIPDHDVAFFVASEIDAPTRARFAALYGAWPRPALNDPTRLEALARDVLPGRLAGAPGVCAPPSVLLSRAGLAALAGASASASPFGEATPLTPCLVRPAGTHAGEGLARAETRQDLLVALAASTAERFHLTAFEDSRGADGLYRKARVAFIDGRPFLCHLALSEHWMVHYLNAGMVESVAKRAEEALAMATFETGFARRHAAAFAAVVERLGFDYFQIDCGETRDGRLLVFEAAVAGLIHAMDPPDLFPYKRPQMMKTFAAFEAMLRWRASGAAAAAARGGTVSAA